MYRQLLAVFALGHTWLRGEGECVAAYHSSSVAVTLLNRKSFFCSHLSINECSNTIVRMCVFVFPCHTLSERRCGRAVAHPAFVLSSFERSIPLLSEYMKFVEVSFHLILIQYRSDPLDKSHFFLMFCWIVGNSCYAKVITVPLMVWGMVITSLCSW